MEVRKGEISKITGLQLNTNNGLYNPVYLGGYGVEIYGDVEILGDSYILNNLIIHGDLVLASPSQLSFTFDSLTVNSTTKITDEHLLPFDESLLYLQKCPLD